MNTKKHLLFFGLTFGMWLLFYIIGMPFNYFLDFSVNELINLTLIGAFGAIPFFALFTLSIFGRNYVKESFWLAFYASVPLFFYDYIIIGIIHGEGLNFLRTHWILTVGYLEVWIIIPAFGLILSKLASNKK